MRRERGPRVGPGSAGAGVGSGASGSAAGTEPRPGGAARSRERCGLKFLFCLIRSEDFEQRLQNPGLGCAHATAGPGSTTRDTIPGPLTRGNPLGRLELLLQGGPDPSWARWSARDALKENPESLCSIHWGWGPISVAQEGCALFTNPLKLDRSRFTLVCCSGRELQDNQISDKSEK
ncbi:hypothetical protein DV515_00017278 [Chloebia gouldiae]|uniref:Uncharacterized protein n=1 Tax=Chloebia gouldiae TaxID=44316 RepID=A0A3L8R0E3_CHLGU|nr:hypothetical protein DV515_00017277 [Chloebia gouldiae]RLV73079.1 hypothetical protein DV515_00017278 [Chloebia gouldiae]